MVEKPKGAALGENGERRAEGLGRDDAPMRPENEGAVKLLLGRTSCVVGIVLAVGGTIAALEAGAATVSAGALGTALGVLGYFLGSRRLGTITVALCTFALLLGIAASQGLIPGIAPTDRGLPAVEPRS